MKAFIEPLQELSGYEDMTKAAMQPGLVTISGCIIRQRMCCFINRISAETFLPQSGSVHCGQFMKMNR